MQTNKYIKGLVTGACVGLAVSTMVGPMNKKTMKHMNHKVNKTWANVGNMIDGVMNNFN
ncbi:MAG: hypothetical protein FWE47_02085 [Oscillospiraceae bacterium]|nr:hypothetical protein [Oscillospiraceae bacterium]